MTCVDRRHDRLEMLVFHVITNLVSHHFVFVIFSSWFHHLSPLQTSCPLTIIHSSTIVVVTKMSKDGKRVSLYAMLGSILSAYALYVEHKMAHLPPDEEFTALCDIDAIGASCR